MKIVFFPAECCPFHGQTLEERPLGGTETGVIRLSEALAELGEDVFVVTSLKEFPETKPRYISIKEANSLGEIDVLIAARGWKSIFLPFNAKKRFFWTGDAYDNLHTLGLGDRRFIDKIDGLFLVSEWHAQTICQSSGFPLSKTFILRNGVHLKDFSGEEKRNRKRLIYSSTPNRGLIYMPEIFNDLKRLHPNLELHIFSSLSLYRPYWPPIIDEDDGYQELFERLRALPDCYTWGSIPQSLLAREFMKSALLAYPSNFEETSCITAMEAQAGGCPVVTSRLAALPETVGDGGVLIAEEAGSHTYREKFVEACDRLLSDDQLFSQFSQHCLKRAQGFDWRVRAQQLLQFLKGA